MTLEFTDSFNIQPKTGGGGSTINNQDKTITENGTYQADSGYTGLGTVTVDVEPTITSLSITPSTSSQTITAPTGTDGYSPINVSAVTSSIDNNITASNIKKNVTILGVTGSYEPTLTTKNIMQNGTYNASSDNADGYSSVTVNVSAPTGLTLSTGQPVLMSSPLSTEIQGYKGQNETVTSTGSTYNYPNFVDRISDFYDDGTNTIILASANVLQKGGTILDDGVFTGESGAYLIIPSITPLKTANSWEFQTKYTYKKNSGNFSYIIKTSSKTNDFTTPYLEVDQLENFTVWLSSAKENPFVTAGDTGLVAVNNTTYYIKFGFTGSLYYFDYNTTGWDDTFTRQWTYSTTTKACCEVPMALMGASLAPSDSSLGNMDLKETSITINGNIWWKGTYNLQGKDYQGIKISKNNIKSFVQPVLSSNGTMGGNSFAVEASSEYQGTTTASAFKAFDGTFNNAGRGAWWATTNANQWLTFYNPSPLCVKALNIQNGYDRNTIANWELLASNDNQNWTTITSGTNTNTTDYAIWTIDASSNTNYYKYYRINALTGAAITDYIAISEAVIIADEKYIDNYWYLDDTNNTVQTPTIDNTKDIYFMVGDNYTASATIIY